MGGVNIPLEANNLQQYKPADPLEEFQRASALKSQAQQQQMQAQEMQVRQRQITDQDAMTQAMLHDWDGKDPNVLPTLALRRGMSANGVFSAQQAIMGRQLQKNQLTKEQNELESQHNDAQLGALQAAGQVPDDQLSQHLASAAQDLHEKGHLDDQHMPNVQQIAQLASTDPAAARQHLAIYEKSLMGEKEQFSQAQTAQENKFKQQQADTAEWKESGPGQLINVRTGETKGTLRQPVDQQELNDFRATHPGTNAFDFAAAKAKLSPMTMIMQNQLPQGPNGNPALDQAAERYSQTGTLPPGFVRSPGTLTAIMNRAAQLHPDGNIAGNEAVYKSNQKALGSLQDQFSRVSAFEGTALRNLDLYVQKAQAIPDLQARFANIPLRMITGKMIGEQNYAAMNAARQTAAAEVGKVLSSATGAGVLSDSQRKEAQDVLDGNLPLAATLSVVQTLKQDLGNRHAAYNQEINQLRGMVGGKPADQKQVGGQAGGGQQASGPPSGATHTAKGSDGKIHYTNNQGQDLGVAP